MQPTQPLLTLSSSPQQGKVRGTTLCFRPQRFDGSVAARPRAQNLADSRWVVEIGRGAGEGKDEKDEKGGKGREREREGGREGGGCVMECWMLRSTGGHAWHREMTDSSTHERWGRWSRRDVGLLNGSCKVMRHKLHRCILEKRRETQTRA